MPSDDKTNSFEPEWTVPDVPSELLIWEDVGIVEYFRRYGDIEPVNPDLGCQS